MLMETTISGFGPRPLPITSDTVTSIDDAVKRVAPIPERVLAMDYGTVRAIDLSLHHQPITSLSTSCGKVLLGMVQARRMSRPITQENQVERDEATRERGGQ
jgi:hypothetical protein